MTDRFVHLADRDEGRGRVVLHVTSAEPNQIAVAAAVALARAFHSRVESVFVEDDALADGAAYAFTRELSHCGRTTRAFTPHSLAVQLDYAHRIAADRIGRRASAADVPHVTRVMRDEALRALSIACAEAGPWNVIALAEPFGAHDAAVLDRLIGEISGMTGLLLVGPHARRLDGAIAVVIESAERLASMLRAADRIAAEDHRPIEILLLADTDDEIAELEGQVRLMLSERPDLAILSAPPTHGHTGAAAEALRRLAPGFVLAASGGVLVPRAGSLASLALAAEAPLFLVR